jgi:hypothetical protein
MKEATHEEKENSACGAMSKPRMLLRAVQL